MMTKMTSGPWNVGRDALSPSGTMLTVRDSNQRIIAEVVEGEEDAETGQATADARLIAAAPEMLDALRQVLRCSKCRDCRERADALLARIEGA